MHVAILGFEREGQASYEYFSGRGDTVTICDQDPDKVVPDGVEAVLGDSYLDDLDRFDLLVRTAYLNPEKILARNPGVAHKISSGLNEFLRVSPSRNLIGITGTKGKGTTSTLVARMLEAEGHTVHLAGNIGVPVLSLLPNIQPQDWVVIELSSFQLCDVQYSPHIAVCLMMAPEHLDWHGSEEAYYTAKEQLFARQATNDIAIYYHDDEVSRRIASAGQGRKLPYCHVPGAEVFDDDGITEIVIDGQYICRTDELKLLGRHNWQNVCAAVTTVWTAATSANRTKLDRPAEKPDIAAMRQVLTSFSGLPFRLEFRREVARVRYYDDSFASAPPAPLAAMRAIDGPKVMIIGGHDRGLDLAALIDGLKAEGDGIRSVLVIGAAGPRITEAFAAQGFDNFSLSTARDMPQIVAQAATLARPGDAVVLSPGFPSFDMFKDFEDRGWQFNQAVDALAETSAEEAA